MIEFFSNLANNIEDFFKTPLATAIGAVFLVVMAALILLLLKYFEDK